MTAKESCSIWLDLVNGIQSKYFDDYQLASVKDKLSRLKFKRKGVIVKNKWHEWVRWHYPDLLKQFERIRGNGKGQLNLF